MTEPILSTPSRERFDSEVQRLEGRIDSELESIVSDSDPRLNHSYTASTEDELKNQLLAARDAGGGTVVIVGQTTGVKTYVLDDLRIPTTVRLVSRGGVRLQSPTGSGIPMIVWEEGVVGSRIEGLTIDHTPGYHGTVYYDASTTPDYDGPNTVVVRGKRNHIVGCEVIGSCMDAINMTSGVEDCHVVETHVEGADRQGMNIGGPQASPTQGARVHRCSANDTYAAGIGAIGPVHDGVISFCRVTNTGGSGDAVAAYSPYNDGLTLIGVSGRNLGNNGTHIGGDRVKVIGSVFDTCAGTGIIYESQHDLYRQDVYIAGNTVDDAALRGIQVVRCSDARLAENRVLNSGSHNYQMVDSTTIALTNCYGYGITGASGSSLRLDGASRVKVMGGHYDRAKSDAIYGGDTTPVGGGSAVASTNVKIIGADIRSSGGYAVRSSGGATKWIVAHNDMVGNANNSALLAGANNINGPNI